MLSLDLFDSKYERELREGAVDNLEARRIDDLATKMDDLVARAKQATTPEVKAALVKEFQKCKAERDSYFKIKDECMGYGSIVGETEEEEDDWYDANGRPNPHGAYDAAGHYYADREDQDAGYDAYKERDWTEESGIPGNVPTEKIPGKEDLLKGKGRSYYEGKVTPIKGGIRHHARPGNYGGYEPEPELKGLNKTLTKNLEKGMGIEFKRAKKYQGGIEVDETGIPGSVPTEKIPGKEDLLKGKGRSYYEDQKKNSEVTDPAIDRLLTKAHKEYPKARSNAEALAMKILGKEQSDVARLDRVNDREDRMIDRLADLEQNLQQQINDLKQSSELDEHGGGIGPKQHWQDLMQERKLSVGDPIVVTGPNEFEGKTGEIAEFSPSGRFVVVNLYNHGEHSMHLSDVEFNQYAADQEDEDDWYDDGAEDTMESAMSELDAVRQDLERMNDRQFYTAYGISKQAFQQKYRTLLKPTFNQDTPVEEDQGAGQVAVKAADDAVVDTMSGMAEGFQDFNKVEPYAVCLAGKPVKKFDYYEDARRFHDNWKKKLYNQGEQDKADKITLMPLNLDEEGKGTPVPAKEFARGVLKDLKKVNVKEEGRVDPILLKALNNMPDGLATHGQVLNAAYDAYAMELGKMRMKSEYGTTRVYIPKLMSLYKDKHDLTFNEAYSKTPANLEVLRDLAQQWQDGSDTAYDAIANLGWNISDDRKGVYIIKQSDMSGRSKIYFPELTAEAANPAQQAAIAINMKKHHKKPKQVDEFAPGPEREDDDVPDQILQLANRWWNATDDQPKITNVLRSLGWSIAQVESEDDAVQMQHNDGTTYFISADDFDPDVFEALSRKDLLKQVGDKLNDPEFRKKPADPTKRWEKGDLYQGPGPDDYGHTGYQGHGMPTDKAERARIRADKKKGVAEAETDYSKRRQHERDVDAGKPVAKPRQPKMTDYQKRRAQDKKDMELGEEEQLNEFLPALAALAAPVAAAIGRSALTTGVRIGANMAMDDDEEEINEEQDTSGVERAILNRIMTAHTDLLMKFGPEKVMQAAEEVAYNVGDVDEIGTSDVSGWVNQVKQILGAE